jgi:hypothetical protein
MNKSVNTTNIGDVIIISIFALLFYFSIFYFSIFQESKNKKSRRQYDPNGVIHKQNSRDYIILPKRTQLCPVDRVNDQSEAKFCVSLVNDQNIRIYDDVYIIYRNIVYLLHGERPFNGEELYNNYLTKATKQINIQSQYNVVLDKSTKYNLDAEVDNVGIVKCLQAKQSFRVKPGSKIIVPKGSVLSHTGFSIKGNLLAVDEGDMLLLDDIECNIVTPEQTTSQVTNEKDNEPIKNVTEIHTQAKTEEPEVTIKNSNESSSTTPATSAHIASDRCINKVSTEQNQVKNYISLDFAYNSPSPTLN